MGKGYTMPPPPLRCAFRPCIMAVMTTQTINNIGDLARILREQPEWADTIRGLLLGEELLNLPAQLAEFVQVSQENNRQVREELAQQRQLLGQHSAQLVRLNELVAQHSEQLIRINEVLAQHGEHLTQINEVMAQHIELLRQHTEVLRQHTELLTQHSAQLAQHGEQLAQILEQLAQHGEILAQHGEILAQHSEILADHRAQMTELRRRLSLVEGRLSNVEGSAYERNVRAKALFRAQHRLGLAEPYIALTQDGQAAPQLHRAISRALSSGVLSLDQSSEVYDTDLIISGADNRHVVIEVSITAGDDDIRRARRRADYLALATGGTATPAVITAVLDEAQRAQAADQEVATFIVPYP